MHNSQCGYWKAHEQAYEYDEKANNVYSKQRKPEQEQIPSIPFRERHALTQCVQGLDLLFYHDIDCETEHDADDDARHDKQYKANYGSCAGKY